MSTSTQESHRRRGRNSRDTTDGPRARFGELLPYILEHRSALVWVIILSILGAAASLAQPVLVSQVIGLVEKGQALGVLVWVLVGLVVAAALLSGLQHYLLQRMGTSVVYSARRQLVARILRLPIHEFDSRRTGDLVSRVGSDTTLLYAVMTQGLVDAVGGALLFVGALIAMLLIDPVLLGLTMLVLVASVVAVVLLSRRIRVASQKQQEKVGDVSAAVERSVSAIRTVRAANATARENDAIDVEIKGAWHMGVRVAKVSALVVPIAGIALQVSLLTVLGVGGFRVASGDITIASLVAFVMFLFLMISPLGQAFGAVMSVNQALGALGRIQEIISLPSEGDDDAVLEDAADAAPASAAAISFDEVRFSYPEKTHKTEAEKVLVHELGEGALDVRDRTVLHGVSFSAARGTRIALVGPSGAGKSTILALIERFYDPSSGVIRVDGVDIRSLDRTELRSRIGYVEQDAPVLAGNLRDNLTLGAPNASDADCIRVLESVNLTEVLQRDPSGLDAQVGESGVMLSGGERQRLAIARALLAAPPILLLDESTSSLDGLNEQLLRKAIDAVAENRTLIVIAHRLSTVVDSDQIVVLDHGRVVGVGTHSELVASTPLYKELAKHQLLV
ncbi:MAG: ABC transporter ATP-binding protein [Terrimesophilobacter sp.]